MHVLLSLRHNYVSNHIAWGMTAPFLWGDIRVDDLPNLHGSVFEPPIICNHHALSEAPYLGRLPPQQVH